MVAPKAPVTLAFEQNHMPGRDQAAAGTEPGFAQPSFHASAIGLRRGLLLVEKFYPGIFGSEPRVDNWSDLLTAFVSPSAKKLIEAPGRRSRRSRYLSSRKPYKSERGSTPFWGWQLVGRFSTAEFP